jgi:hypothetical protein
MFYLMFFQITMKMAEFGGPRIIDWMDCFFVNLLYG